MRTRKIECSNGWITFIVTGHTLAQIHSTGLVHTSRDDRAAGADLLRLLEADAMSNNLHSQQPGQCGVRWPELY